MANEDIYIYTSLFYSAIAIALYNQSIFQVVSNPHNSHLAIVYKRIQHTEYTIMARSMLHRLEDLCNVDVDDADTGLIKSIPFTPHNRTSQSLTPIFIWTKTKG